MKSLVFFCSDTLKKRTNTFIHWRSALAKNKKKRQFFFYLQHLRDLGPLLRRVLRLNEQLVQQRLLVELTHQFTLQVLFHVVHQEVHHRLGHAEDTMSALIMSDPVKTPLLDDSHSEGLLCSRKQDNKVIL